MTHTGIPVFEILDRLALGQTEEEILKWARSSRYAAGANQLSREGIRAAAAYAAVLTQETKLSPPAEAAFCESLPVAVSPLETRERTGVVLAHLARGLSKQEVIAQHPDLSAEQFQAAVAYGIRLVRHERLLSAPRETPGQTYLRDGLTVDDRMRVEEIRVYYEFVYRATPEELFETWKRFVEDVERGYDDIYDEYVWALGRRDHLEDTVVTIVSPASQERLDRLIRPWDQRFEAATLPSKLAIFPLRWTVRRWWWQRVPTVPGEALSRHLDDVGLSS